MGVKSWIVYGIICVVVVATALLLLLVLVPETNNTGVQAGEYEKIAKQEYTFSGGQIETLEKQYGVTQATVDKDKKADKFDDGNINPFTPKSEVTIYNEPTLKNEGSTTLTPDSK